MVLDVDSICSGVHLHFIMMEKSALAGEGGGARPTPFTLFTITYKVAVYAPAESAFSLPLFHLCPICTLRYGRSQWLPCFKVWPTMVLGEPRGMDNYGTWCVPRYGQLLNKVCPEVWTTMVLGVSRGMDNYDT